MAGVLCATGWASLGYVHSLPQFYAMYAVAGLGNAFVYCCSTALGLKWAGYTSVRDAYAWEPTRQVPGVGAASVLGVEAPLWSETVQSMADA